MPLKAVIVPVTAFAQNCSVIWCDQSGQGAVIDPGGDLERIMAVVAEHQVRLQKILLTHAHIDHAGATAQLARREGLPIEGPQRGDSFWIEQLPGQSAMFGLPPAESFEPARWLEHGDEVQVGELTLQVLHCPGHTPGHVVFFDPGSRLAFVGDVLFAGSIGRSDFPGGDQETLLGSIRERLLPLGDDVRFLPGHGPMSTFGQERLHNPYLRLSQSRA